MIYIVINSINASRFRINHKTWLARQLLRYGGFSARFHAPTKIAQRSQQDFVVL